MKSEIDVEFSEIVNTSIVNRHVFYSEHNANTIFISQDNQGLHWGEFQRDNWYNNYLRKNIGYRDVKPITQKEKDERRLFHSSTGKDLFYQFNHFYGHLSIYLTHFQIRKNLKKISKELFYIKHYGIESFDLITYKQQTLIGFNEDEANRCLCFDLMKEDNGDYLLCLGKANSECELLRITNESYRLVKKNKAANISPRFERVFSSNELTGAFINYVTFIPNNRLISVSNDKCLRMYDLIKENKVIFSIESKSPFNHCDINEDAGLIVCVGDSTTVDIIDLKAKAIAHRISEHFDYGMVIKFNPYDSNLFATGNQDFSCRIWDLRKLDQSVHQLHGFLDTIGDLAWMRRDRLVYGENSLFAHVYDLSSRALQSLGYFGALSGVIHDDKTDKIYCGVSQKEKSGIIEYSLIDNANSIRNCDL